MAGPVVDTADTAHRPRIAIGFFGLARSLKWTLPSIKENIIARTFINRLISPTLAPARTIRWIPKNIACWNAMKFGWKSRDTALKKLDMSGYCRMAMRFMTAASHWRI